MIAALLLAQTVTPDQPAVEIYTRAVLAMRAIAEPAYVRFDTRVTSKRRGAIVVQHIAHVERTSDRAVIATDDDSDVDPRVTPFEIAPDLFVGHLDRRVPAATSDGLAPGLDDATVDPLKTLGVERVIAVNYRVTIAGAEDLPDCAGAIHLKLEPERQPLTYNLRDLWIDPATSRIRKAVAVWRGHVGAVRVLAPITLDIDRRGFIERFSTLVSAHFLVGETSIRQDAEYGAIRGIDEAEWSTALEDERMRDAKP